MVIGVFQNGVQVGYVNSISTYKFKFAITKVRDNAKQYNDYNSIMSDIDLCQKMCKGVSYGFSIM